MPEPKYPNREAFRSEQQARHSELHVNMAAQCRKSESLLIMIPSGKLTLKEQPLPPGLPGKPYSLVWWVSKITFSR